MKSSLSSYTRRDTSILKGFAILCIVFHNYFHWLAPSPGENEFDFSPLHVRNLFQLLGEQPGEFVNILFSFFGHYGVQLFVMLSGFGLVISMLNRPRSWESFVLNRLKKLYPLLLTGILVVLLGKLVMDGTLFEPWAKTEFKYKLLLIHTLIPNSGLSINGPWWFFGLIFQLYLLFPLLFRCMKKWGWKAFWVVCALSYGLIFLFREGLNLFHGSILMQNAPGHLPEFCFGMMLAFSKGKRIHWGWLLLSLLLFVWGNFAPGLYPFTFLSITVIAVFAYNGLKSLPIKKKLISRPLAYFGGISMALFAVHGFFRNPVLHWANTLTTPLGHLWSGLVFLALSWGIAIAAKALYDFICAQLDRIHIRESRATRIIGRVCQVGLCLFFAYVLGYYVAQNYHKCHHAVTSYDIIESSSTVSPDKEYTTLAKTTFTQKHQSLRVKMAFDVCSLDTTAPLPSMVLHIDGVLWNQFAIPSEYNTSTFKHYENTVDFQCPFVKSVKDKRLVLYFWNRNKGTIRFENAEVEILY